MGKKAIVAMEEGLTSSSYNSAGDVVSLTASNEDKRLWSYLKCSKAQLKIS